MGKARQDLDAIFITENNIDDKNMGANTYLIQPTAASARSNRFIEFVKKYNHFLFYIYIDSKPACRQSIVISDTMSSS